MAWHHTHIKTDIRWVEYSTFANEKKLDHLHDWLINPLECFFSIWGHVVLDKIRDRDMIPYPYDRSQEIFIVHVPITNSTHYPAFYTVRLHCQTPTLTPAYQAGRQFAPYLNWYLVPGRDVNPQPTAWEAETWSNHL